MSSGQIGLKGTIETGSTVTYQRTASDIGAVMGRFLRGRHDRWTFCTSEEDFKSQFGEVALADYEMDFEFVVSYFRASEENGRLWVRNVYYYRDNPWDIYVTAALANTTADGLDATKRIWFEAYSRGVWAHATEKELKILIRETTQRATGSGWVDILVYYNGTLKKSYLNMSWDVTQTRNVRDTIPAVGDGWVIPHWVSDGVTTNILNDGGNPYYEFAGGNNGLSGSLSEPLTEDHWLGESHPDGASGFTGLVQYINDIARRPTFIINQLCGESYEWEHYDNLTNFCRAYWLTHFSTPPMGYNRQSVSDWKIGAGDAHDRAVLYGEARVSWPEFYPRNSSNATLVIPSSAADAGRMVARIYRSGGHVHEAYVGTDGDQGSLALVTTRLALETGEDDLNSLNPLGICVINSSLGGIYLDGSRTMATDWRFLEMSTRRHLAVVIMAGILAQSRWMVHGLNDEGYENSPGIWRRGTLSMQAFMYKYAADGAFTSKEMGVGWMAVLGEPYTTQEDVADRIARSRIGICPRSVAEMIYFSLGVEEGQLNAAPAPTSM